MYMKRQSVSTPAGFRAGFGSTEVREGLVKPGEGLRLEHGGPLEEVSISFRIAGPPGAPVVAVLGGISADRKVCRTHGGITEGWWEWMVGNQRPVDLRRWRVLTIDYLAGRGDSSAPPVWSGKEPRSIPAVTPGDQARALAEVISTLELGRLDGVIGASYGGAVALAMAALRPDLLRRALVIGAAHEPHPLATALRVIQRRIVQEAAAGGRDRAGVALARCLAMATYRSDRSFSERFSNVPTVGSAGAVFPVESWMDYQGEKFSRAHSAASFLCLSQSLDLHRVDPASVSVPVTLVSIDPDLLVPRWQMEALHQELGEGHEIVRIDSHHGHDAFLKEKETFSSVVRHFLTRLENAS